MSNKSIYYPQMGRNSHISHEQKVGQTLRRKVLPVDEGKLPTRKDYERQAKYLIDNHYIHIPDVIYYVRPVEYSLTPGQHTFNLNHETVGEVLQGLGIPLVNVVACSVFSLRFTDSHQNVATPMINVNYFCGELYVQALYSPDTSIGSNISSGDLIFEGPSGYGTSGALEISRQYRNSNNSERSVVGRTYSAANGDAFVELSKGYNQWPLFTSYNVYNNLSMRTYFTITVPEGVTAWKIVCTYVIVVKS